MWMSEARRLSASNTVESTSLMIGDWSAWILSIERTSVPVLVVAQELDLEGLRGLLEHPLRALAALEASWMAEGVPPRLDGRLAG